MKGVYETYTDDFKADALNLIRKGDRSICEIGRDLGVSHWVLRRWCKTVGMKRGKPPVDVAGGVNETPEQRIARLERENERLRKENDALRTDREILKKAAAFFAKESE
jgi:transposase